jgi:two-component system, NarL family, invasion response regulator UvrY
VPDPISVLTVDDQPLFRAAARDVIVATPGFELIGEASSGLEAIDRFAELDPDLVLMNVRMPGLDGIETTRRLRALRPDAAVVLISLDDISDMAKATERSGALAFVRKQDLCPRVLADVWDRVRS